MGIDELNTGNVQGTNGQYNNSPVQDGANNNPTPNVTVVKVKIDTRGMGTSVQSERVNPFDAEVDKALLQKSLGKSSGLVAADTLADSLETLSTKFTEIQAKLNRLRRDTTQSPAVRNLATQCLADLEGIDFKKGYPTPADKGNKNVRMMRFNNEVIEWFPSLVP